MTEPKNDVIGAEKNERVIGAGLPTPPKQPTEGLLFVCPPVQTRLYWICNSALWLCLLHNLILRDSFSPVAFVYYATPPIVLAIPAIFLAWWERRWHGTLTNRASAVHRATTALAILCLLDWGWSSFRSGSIPPHSPSDMKLTFWNTGRGEFANWDAITAELQKTNEDVIALAEVTGREVQSQAFWKEHFPEYTAASLRENLIVLVKDGDVEELDHGDLAGGGCYRLFAINLRGERFQILLADLASNPFRSRQSPLNRLFEVLQKNQNIPTLVVGDFNTPPTSICFDKWKSHLTRAWDAAGTGYEPTWPQPLPILAIDHLWGNQHITFRHCRAEWSRCSDHRRLVADFRVCH